MTRCDNGCGRFAILHTEHGNRFCSPLCCREYHSMSVLQPKRTLFNQNGEKVKCHEND